MVTFGSDTPTYVSLDLETTGLNTDSDDVIEIGAIKFSGERVLATFSTLVVPQREVPASIARLTGIDPDRLRTAPPFAAVAENLRAFVGGLPLVGQNIKFDVEFLSKKGLRLPGPALDTFDLAALVLPASPDYSLATISRELGIVHDRPHRAMADAQMAMEVFVKCVAMLERLPPAALAEAGRIASRSPEWPIRTVLMDLAERAELTLEAGEPGLEGVDLPALAGRLRTPAQGGPRKGPAPVDMEMVRAVLGETGAMSSTLGAFEARPEQLLMAEAVAGVFNRGGQLIAEAGTGTGKSLAYLVPAALFAAQTGERVVVSTNTINLQEQIAQKDIPDALRALANTGAITDAEDVRFALLKGRSNYLCLRKWATLKNRGALSPAEAKTVIKLLLWLHGTRTGDRSEMNLTPPEAQVWERLSASGYDDATGPCPMTKRGLCFYAAAHERAKQSHLLSINHALLSLDAKMGALVPAYQHLVIDEAHTLEEAATNQFGFEVDDGVLDLYLGTIAGGEGVSGLPILPRFRLALRPPLGETRIRELDARCDELDRDIQACRQRLSALFKQLSEFVGKALRGQRDADSRLQLEPPVRAQPGWARVVAAWEDVNIAFEKVHRGLVYIESQITPLAETIGPQAEDFRQEVAAAVRLGQDLMSNLASALVRPEEGVVHWLSIGMQEAQARVHSAPLNVGPFLKERLFNRMRTVVLTGATLSTEGNFEYLKERLSLTPAAEVLLGSPFDYARAALVYIPHDMPDPTAPNYQATLDQTITDVARAAHGRTLVLFTSRSSMKNTRNDLKEPLAAEGITVLAQGIDGSPRQLIRTFRSTPNTVLLGTGSFWEGVDIAGDALSVLVIARLPFPVPTEPVFAARSRQFDDPFNHYAVPQAVIRFRQGFGRLIRRKTDRGVFIVLDRRIFSKDYGPAFLDSLPPASRQVGPARDIPAVTARWLAQRPLPAGR